jgi:hypothetical protein
VSKVVALKVSDLPVATVGNDRFLREAVHCVVLGPLSPASFDTARGGFANCAFEHCCVTSLPHFSSSAGVEDLGAAAKDPHCTMTL